MSAKGQVFQPAFQHTLDTKEMARLIDGAIYVAKGLGIDTDTPICSDSQA